MRGLVYISCVLSLFYSFLFYNVSAQTQENWSEQIDLSGNCLDFDSSYCASSTSLSLQNSFTIETWLMVRPNRYCFCINTEPSDSCDLDCVDTIMPNPVFSLKDQSLYFGFGSELSFLFALDGDTMVSSSNAIDYNDWEHWALSYDVNTHTAKVYRNGFFQFHKYFEKNPEINADFYLGFDGENFFNGRLDEFRIWDKALTKEEVREKMFASPIGLENDLLLYYRFDETKMNDGVASISDKTLHGHYIQMNGFTMEGSRANLVPSQCKAPKLIRSSYNNSGDLILKCNYFYGINKIILALSNDVGFSSCNTFTLDFSSSDSLIVLAAEQVKKYRQTHPFMRIKAVMDWGQGRSSQTSHPSTMTSGAQPPAYCLGFDSQKKSWLEGPSLDYKDDLNYEKINWLYHIEDGFAISAWVKCTEEFPDHDYVLSCGKAKKDKYLQMGYRNSSKKDDGSLDYVEFIFGFFGDKNDLIYKDYNYVPGEWVHWTVFWVTNTFSFGTGEAKYVMRICRNGEEVASMDDGHDFFKVSGTINIGRYKDDNDTYWYFDGYLDNLKMKFYRSNVESNSYSVDICESIAKQDMYSNEGLSHNGSTFFTYRFDDGKPEINNTKIKTTGNNDGSADDATFKNFELTKNSLSNYHYSSIMPEIRTTPFADFSGDNCTVFWENPDLYGNIDGQVICIGTGIHDISFDSIQTSSTSSNLKDVPEVGSFRKLLIKAQLNEFICDALDTIKTVHPFEAGNAAFFDGASSINAGNDAIWNLQSPMSIMAWVKADELSSEWQTVLSKGNDCWSLQRNGSGPEASFSLTTQEQTYVLKGGFLNDFHWHHLAGILDGSDARFYVDGVLVDEQLIVGTININDAPLYIGANAKASDRNWNGSIDEVQIYKRALSADELLKAMHQMPSYSNGFESDLIAYYNFNMVSGNVLYDATNNQMDATCEGNIQWLNSSAMQVIADQISDITEHSFRVSWQQIADCEAYDVITPFGSYKVDGAANTSYTVEDVSLQTAKTYTVQVGAFYAADTSVSVQLSDTLSFRLPPGNACAFNGATSLNISDVASINGSFSYQTWLCPDTNLEQNATLFSSDDLLIEILPNCSVQIQCGGQAFTSDEFIVLPGYWQHLALSFDANQTNLFINGVEVFTFAFSLPSNISLLPAVIGANTNDKNYYAGLLDESSILTTTLTADVVKQMMYQSLDAQNNDLFLYQTFDNASGQTVPDASLNAYDALLKGKSSFPESEAWCVTGIEVTNTYSSGCTISFDLIQTDAFNITNYKAFLYDDAACEQAIDSAATSNTHNLLSIFHELKPGDSYYIKMTAIFDGISDHCLPLSAPLAFSFMLPPGNCLSFDGINDYIDIGAGAFTNFSDYQDFSIAFWAAPNAGDSYIFSNRRAEEGSYGHQWFKIGMGSDFTLNCELSQDNTAATYHSFSGDKLNPNQWNHICFTRTNANGKDTYTFYQNGSVSKTYSCDALIVADQDDIICIGKWLGYSNGQLQYSGLLDELKLYSTALSAEQVQTIMYSGSTSLDGLYDAQVLDYTFDEGIPSGQNQQVNLLPNLRASDVQPQGNLHDFALSGNESNWVMSTIIAIPEIQDIINISNTAITLKYSVIGLADSLLVEIDDNTDFSSPILSNYYIDASQTEATISGLNLMFSKTYSVRLRQKYFNFYSDFALKAFAAPSSLPSPAYALSFDGVDDYLDLGDGVQACGSDNTYSIAVWVYSKAEDDAFHSIIGNQEDGGGTETRSPCIYIRKQTGVHFGHGSDSAWKSTTIENVLNPNSWNHIATVYDGSTLSLYVNAELKKQFSVGAPDYQIIRSIGYLGNFFKGSMDELSIWGKALTQSEIQSLMLQSPEGAEDNLLAYFNFDQNNSSEISSFGSEQCQAEPVGNPDFETSGAMAPIVQRNFTLNSSKLQWNQCEGAKNYRIQIAADSAFSYILYDDVSSSTEADLNTLDLQLNPGDLCWSRIAFTRSENNWQSPFSQALASIVPAFGNHCLNFDGIDDYALIQKPPANIPSSKITLECWFLVDEGSLTTQKSIIQKPFTSHIAPYYQYGLFLTDVDNSGNIDLSFDLCLDGTIKTLSTVPSNLEYGKWYHSAASYDGSNMYLYLDGELLTQTAASGSMSNYNTPLSLAYYPNLPANSTYCYAGNIDEVCVWNSARTAAQIQDDMDSIPVSDIHLCQYYSFDQGRAATENHINNRLLNAAEQDADMLLHQCVLNGNTSNWIESPLSKPLLNPAFFVGSAVQVSWRVEQEVGIDHYKLEYAMNDPVLQQAESQLCNEKETQIEGLVLNAFDVVFYRVSALDGNGNTIAISEIASFINERSQPGTALDFDGVDDCLDITTDPVPIDSDVSFAVWVNFNDVSTSQYILSSGAQTSSAGYFICTNGSQFDIGRSTSTTSVSTGYIGSLTAGKWMHLAAVYDHSAANLSLYFDGILLSVVEASNTGFDNGFKNLTIGKPNNVDNYYLNAKLGSVSIWNTALSADQIKDALYDPSGVAQDGLVFYTPFEEGVAGADNRWLTNIQNNVGAQQSMDITVFDRIGDSSNFVYAPVVFDAQDNTAMNFDGVDDYISTDIGSSLNGSFTISAWVKPSDSSGCIAGGYDDDGGLYYSGCSFGEFKNGNWFFGCAYYSYLQGSNNFVEAILFKELLPLNKWSFITAVYGHYSVNVYVDGIQLAFVQMPDSYIPYNNFYIGSLSSVASTHSFQGDLDGFSVWNAELSVSDILYLMEHQPKGDETNLIYYQAFDQGVPFEDNRNLTVDGFHNFAQIGYSSNWVAHTDIAQIECAAKGPDFFSVEFLLPENYPHQILAVADNPDLLNAASYASENNAVSIQTETNAGGTYYCQGWQANSNGVACIKSPVIKIDMLPAPGNSIRFDQDSVVLSGNTMPSPSNSFSIEFWANPDEDNQISIMPESLSGFNGQSNQHYIYAPCYGGDGAGVGVSLGSNGISVVEHGSSYIPTRLVYAFPQNIVGWHHFAVIYNNGTPSLYIDGQFIKSALASQRTVYASWYMFGAGDYGRYQGQLDEIRLWDHPLTSEELIANMHQELQGDENGLLRYCNFNQSQGTTILESHGNNGEIKGSEGNRERSGAMCPAVLAVTSASLSDVCLAKTPFIDDLNGLADFSSTQDFGDYFAQLLPVNSEDTACISIPEPALPTSGMPYYLRMHLENDHWVSPSSEICYYIPPGNGLNFDGVDDYALLNGFPLDFMKEPFTIEFWVKSDENSSAFMHPIALGAAHECTFYVYQGHITYKITENRDIRAEKQIGQIDEDWHHIALTYDGDTIMPYFDGNAVIESLAVIAHQVLSQPSMHLGCDGNTSSFFNGSIDNVRIWTKERTSEEIKDAVYTEIPAYDPDLYLNYTFNQGISGSADNASITSIVDFGPQNRQAAMNSFDYLSDASNFLFTNLMADHGLLAATSVDRTGFQLNIENSEASTNGLLRLSTSANDFGDACFYKNYTSSSERIEVSLHQEMNYFHQVTPQIGAWSGGVSAIRPLMIRPGNALQFNGSDQWAAANTPWNYQDECTIMAWVKPAVNNRRMAIICHSDEVGNESGQFSKALYLDDDARFVVISGGQTLKADQIIAPEKWVHLAFSMDVNSTALKMYINGNLAASSANALSETMNMNVPIIAKAFGLEGMNNFMGSMDELRIYNTVLNASEILEAMYTDEPDSSIYYFRFDEKNASQLANSAGGVDAEVSGSPEFLLSEAMLPFLNEFDLSGATVGDSLSAANCNLSWSAMPGVGKWEVQISDNENFASVFAPVFYVDSAEVSLNQELPEDSVIIGSEYYARLRALFMDDAGDTLRLSPWSAVQYTSIPNTNTPPGNALDFDGVDDYISLRQNGKLMLEEFTIELWLYPRSSSQKSEFQGLLGNNDAGVNKRSPSLYIKNGTGLHGGFGDGTNWNSWSVDDVLLQDQWNHIAWSFDGAEFQLFVNAEKVLTAAVTAGRIPYTETRIKYLGYLDTEFFNGRMDELRIWNYARQEEDIFACMNQIIDMDEVPDGLIAYYDFDQGVPGFDNSAQDLLRDNIVYNAMQADGQLINFALGTDAQKDRSNYTVSEAFCPFINTIFFQNENAFDLSWMPYSDVDGIIVRIAKDTAMTDCQQFSYTDADASLSSSEICVCPEDLLAPDCDYYCTIGIEQQKYSSTTGSYSWFSPNSAPRLFRFAYAPGNAVVLDQQQQNYINLGDSIVLDGGEYTLEMWVFPQPSDHDFYSLIGHDPSNTKKRSPCIYLYDSTGIHTGFGTGDKWISATFHDVLRPEVWQHIAVSYEPNTGIHLYVNGVLKAEQDFQGAMPCNTPVKYIGNMGHHPTAKLDEVRIWDKCLLVADIQKNIYKTLDANQSDGLLAYYSFDVQDSVLLSDHSGQQVDAQIINNAQLQASQAFCPKIELPSAITTDGFTAHWLANDAFDQIIIELSENEDFEQIQTWSVDCEASALSFYDIQTAIETEKSYFLRLKSMRNDWESPYSEVILFKLPQQQHIVLDHGNFSVPANILPDPSAFSIEFWLMPTENTTTICTNKSGDEAFMELSINENAFLECDFANDAIAADVSLISMDSLQMNKWNHICISLSDQLLQLYLNGNTDQSIQLPLRDLGTDNKMVFGDDQSLMYFDELRFAAPCQDAASEYHRMFLSIESTSALKASDYYAAYSFDGFIDGDAQIADNSGHNFTAEAGANSSAAADGAIISYQENLIALEDIAGLWNAQTVSESSGNLLLLESDFNSTYSKGLDYSIIFAHNDGDYALSDHSDRFASSDNDGVSESLDRYWLLTKVDSTGFFAPEFIFDLSTLDYGSYQSTDFVLISSQDAASDYEKLDIVPVQIGDSLIFKLTNVQFKNDYYYTLGIFCQNAADALSFDGVDALMTIDDDANDLPFDNAGGDFSIEFWIQSTSGMSAVLGNAVSGGSYSIDQGFGVFLGSPDDHSFGDESNDGYLYWYDGTTSQQLTASAINDDVWHHVALVRSSEQIGRRTTRTLTCYLDGVEQKRNTTTNSSENLLNDVFTVGFVDYHAAQTGYYFNGEMDELRIWNEALALDSIQAYMHRKIPDPSNCLSLIAYYTMDNVSGNTMPNTQTLYPNLVAALENTTTTPSDALYKQSSSSGTKADEISWTDQSIWSTQFSLPRIYDLVKINQDSQYPLSIHSGDTASCKVLTLSSPSSLLVEDGSSLIVHDFALLKDQSAKTSGPLLSFRKKVEADLWMHLSSPVNYTHTSVCFDDIEFIDASGVPVKNMGLVYAQGDRLEMWNEQDHQYELMNDPDDDLMQKQSFKPAKGYRMLKNDAGGQLDICGNVSSNSLTYNLPAMRSGWNLIGNPYPCRLPINDPTENGQSLLDENDAVFVFGYKAFYQFDHETEAFEPISNCSPQSFLNVFQGAFIRSLKLESNFHFNRKLRTHELLADVADERAMIGLWLTSPSGMKSKTSIVFTPEASMGMDNGLDAGLFDVIPRFELCTYLCDNSEFSHAVDLQALPSEISLDTLLIPLGIFADKTGTATLKIQISGQLNAQEGLFLFDALLNQYQLVTEPYTAVLPIDKVGLIENRYFLTFMKRQQGFLQDKPFEVYWNNALYIIGMEGQNPEVAIYDMGGRCVYQQKAGTQYWRKISPVNLPSGTYLIKIQSIAMMQTEKIVIIK